MQQEVLLAFADIQSQFGHETAWCLLGSLKNRVVEVHGVQPMIVLRSSARSATILGCTGPDAVGFYHNHPGAPAALCEWTVSRQDLQTLRNLALHFLLISCGGGVFAFRFRGEPPPGHRVEPRSYQLATP